MPVPFTVHLLNREDIIIKTAQAAIKSESNGFRLIVILENRDEPSQVIIQFHFSNCNFHWKVGLGWLHTTAPATTAINHKIIIFSFLWCGEQADCQQQQWIPVSANRSLDNGNGLQGSVGKANVVTLAIL
jgi:hypothetical protein